LHMLPSWSWASSSLDICELSPCLPYLDFPMITSTAFYLKSAAGKCAWVLVWMNMWWVSMQRENNSCFTIKP
jgi:hypothetical protein